MRGLGTVELPLKRKKKLYLIGGPDRKLVRTYKRKHIKEDSPSGNLVPYHVWLSIKISLRLG